MSRSYSLSPEEISWSRSKGNIEISASTERSALSNPIGRAHGRCKKGDEEESGRKRIRVACSRCRKRKIKCSGPIGGEDQPCLNCKNAGANTYCAFELTGAVKVDLDNFRQTSRAYTFSTLDNTNGPLSYSNEYQGTSLGSIILQYPAPSYSGPFRQPDLTSQTYQTTYNSSHDYYEYGQQANTYGAGSPYPTSETMMQIPLQTHGVLSSQEHLVPWNLEQHPDCGGYDKPPQPISDSPPSTMLPAPILLSTQSSGASSTTASTITDRSLPKPPKTLPPSPVLGNFVVSDVRERLYWQNSYEPHSEGESSRTPSQQTSSSCSSATQSSLLDQVIDSSTELGHYTLLPSSTFDSNLPLPALTDVMQQHLSCNQHPVSDKYQYHYSTLKPIPMPIAIPTTTIDAASMASIGNSTFTHLPYRLSDKCGTFQYQIHNGIRRATSRIAMEVADGGRVVEKL